MAWKGTAVVWKARVQSPKRRRWGKAVEEVVGCDTGKEATQSEEELSPLPNSSGCPKEMRKSQATQGSASQDVDGVGRRS